MTPNHDGAGMLEEAALNERMAKDQYEAALRVFANLVGHGQRQSVALGKEDRSVAFLSPREIEVLKLIALGLSTKQIAAQLGISFKTVQAHRTSWINSGFMNLSGCFVTRSARS